MRNTYHPHSVVPDIKSLDLSGATLQEYHDILRITWPRKNRYGYKYLILEADKYVIVKAGKIHRQWTDLQGFSIFKGRLQRIL